MICLFCGIFVTLQSQTTRQKDDKTEGQKDRRTEGQEGRRTTRQKDRRTEGQEDRRTTRLENNIMTGTIRNYLSRTGYASLSPKAVLFDMDGVCYDSMPYHAVAWQQSMAHFGITMTADDAYATEGARGIDTVRRMVKEQRGEEITLEEAQTMYDLKSELFHNMKPEPPVMPGILELMEQIDAAGLRIGIVTGSGQRPLIARLMNDFGRFLTEEHIVTAYDVTRGKPAPDPYLRGLEKMGDLQPCEAMVVENAPLGVEAGVAARIFTIAVNTGPLPDEVLWSRGADIVLRRMTDLSERWREIYETTKH